MILGLSFGKKKQSSTTSGTVTKDENVTGSQQQSTTGLQQSQSSSTSTSNQTSSQLTDTTSRTNQSQTDRGSQLTRGTTTTLDAGTTTGLSSAVQRLLAGGINDANIASLSNMIAGVTGFNPEAMVSGIVDGARGRGERELQERNAAIQSTVGGTDTTNSMAALLAQQGRNSLERSIAEITAQAVGQAETIRNQNLAAGVGAQGAMAEQAAGLGGILRGAVTTVDNQTLTDQLSQLLGTQNQSGSMTGSQSGTQQQDTQTTQLLQELLNALTTQNTNSIGTENSTTRGRTSGGGLSISL
jgi:hypothetical protein